MQGNTSRPPSVRVEEWRGLSDSARLKAIAEWEKEKAARHKVRTAEGLSEEIPPEDLPDYHAVMKEMLVRYEEKTSPAMACNAIGKRKPLPATGLIATSTGEEATKSDVPGPHRQHQSRMDHLSDRQSEEYFALIHTAIPDNKVYNILAAKEAIDKEWDKLFRLGTFDLSTVEEKRDVAKRYKANNEKCISARYALSATRSTANCRCTSVSTRVEWSSVAI
jgi:hypothetical protein